MQGKNAVCLERGRRLHGHALFAQVKDHASGDTVEAGVGRRVHFLTQRMSPVGSEIVVHRGPSGLFSIRRFAGGWYGWLGERLRSSWVETRRKRSARRGSGRTL